MFLKCSHRIFKRGNMIREQDDARRRAFSIWVRTGRLPPARSASGIEFKFNPWHDPENGRFTFAGTGRYYGRGGDRAKDQVGRGRGKVEYVDDPSKPPIRNMEEADAWRAAELAKHGHKPGYREAIEARYLLYKKAFARDTEVAPTPNPAAAEKATIAQSVPNPPSPPGPPSSPSRPVGGNGDTPVPPRPRSFGRSEQGAFTPGRSGRFAGGGATGSWDEPGTLSPQQSVPDAVADPVGQATPTANARQSEARGRQPVGSERWRKVDRNGYRYEIDEQNRTRRVSGEITLNPEQGRSPTAQRAAGGGDRRETDHGGHYIARRFNGPTEAFNHFAQDASFNRRDYAKLENQWERAKRQGKQVRVKIVPVYEGKSQRPSALNVWFYIDGKEGSHQLPNEPKGRRDVKHRD
jgi:hypothetical protein